MGQPTKKNPGGIADTQVVSVSTITKTPKPEPLIIPTFKPTKKLLDGSPAERGRQPFKITNA